MGKGPWSPAGGWQTARCSEAPDRSPWMGGSEGALAFAGVVVTVKATAAIAKIAPAARRCCRKVSHACCVLYRDPSSGHPGVVTSYNSIIVNRDAFPVALHHSPAAPREQSRPYGPAVRTLRRASEGQYRPAIGALFERKRCHGRPSSYVKRGDPGCCGWRRPRTRDRVRERLWCACAPRR